MSKITSTTYDLKNADRVRFSPVGNIASTNVQAAIEEVATESMPIGTIIYVAKNTAPTGFIKANGALLLKSAYAPLYNVISGAFNVAIGGIQQPMYSLCTPTAGFGGTPQYALTTDGSSLITNTSNGSGFVALQYDFGRDIATANYSLIDVYFTGAGGCGLAVEYSSDAINWTTHQTISITTSSAQLGPYSLSTSARYYRLRVASFSSNGYFVINCFNINGYHPDYFNVPDLRGEFIRGWDDSRGVDSGRSFATNQASENLIHSHLSGVGVNGSFYYNGYTELGSNYSGISGADVTLTPYMGYTGASGGSESRPRNVALLACIKY